MCQRKWPPAAQAPEALLDRRMPWGPAPVSGNDTPSRRGFFIPVRGSQWTPESGRVDRGRAGAEMKVVNCSDF